MKILWPNLASILLILLILPQYQLLENEQDFTISIFNTGILHLRSKNILKVPEYLSFDKVHYHFYEHHV